MKKKMHIDLGLLFIVVFLMGFGLVMVFSASSYESSVKFNDPTYYLRSQFFATIAGFVVMIFFTCVDYHAWEKFAVPAYLGSLGLVALVVTSIGITRNGARRWLNIGGISLQPAEVAKVGVILFFAAYICKMGSKISTRRGFYFSMILAALPSLFVVIITRNLSSAIILFGIPFVMLFTASRDSWRYVFWSIIGIGIGALVVYLVASDILPASMSFRMARIKAWLHPEAYASGKGYQTLQALYSIGAGGITGKGLGQSTQKLGFVPEAQNDMIFSIICEELGLCGGVAVMLMFLILIYKFEFVAVHAPDEFGSLIVTGVMGHIALQVILNVAVVTNTIPNTGITLPFISFGGSSVLFLLAEIGMVLNVSRMIHE
ncbi:MAG: cell division protein FtsW [Lachnospiraceae bacterium]|nr:cell division protein FtsW [Lachnospiraceae bacterium]